MCSAVRQLSPQLGAGSTRPDRVHWYYSEATPVIYCGDEDGHTGMSTVDDVV